MAELTTSLPAAEDHARWRWLLALGVLLLLLGLAGASATTLLELTSLLLFGPLLLASSLIQLVTAFLAGPRPVANGTREEPLTAQGDGPRPQRKSPTPWQLPTKESVFHYIDAGLEAVLGFLIMAHPLVVVTDLVVLVAIFLIARGLVRLIRCRVTHSSARGWTLTAGVAALLLGICVWLGLPVSNLWFVGLCVAVDFICHGVSWTAIALAEKRFHLWVDAKQGESPLERNSQPV